jgi:3-oxoadipate enol-lactonase
MSLLKLPHATVEYAREGAGPDLLLIHSLLTEMTVFDAVAPVLARSHRVTRLNLPGFGASTPLALAGVADWAAHVAAVMVALSMPPATAVFGNGFGAFVALELAIAHGERFGDLIVADVVPAFPEPARVPFRNMAAKVRESGMQAVLDAAIGRMFPAEFQSRAPSTVAQRKERLAGVDAACFAQACLGLAALDLRARLPAIRNRTLVMCGALDQTTPPALAREVAAAIPGATYREIAGSGHCPMLEQPETLVAEIEAFTRARSLAA